MPPPQPEKVLIAAAVAVTAAAAVAKLLRRYRRGDQAGGGDGGMRTVVLKAKGIEVHASPFGATITKIIVPDRDGTKAGRVGTRTPGGCQT